MDEDGEVDEDGDGGTEEDEGGGGTRGEVRGGAAARHTTWTTAAARPAARPATASTPVRALVHPSGAGVRLNASGWNSPLLAFHELVRTSRLYVRDCTPIPPLAPLLFSGETLEVRDAAGGKELLLDGWLQLEASSAATALVLQARRLVRARWDRMVCEAAAVHAVGGRADRRGWTGRFSGQPLLDAIQPLLEQRALPVEPPRRKGDSDRGGRKRANDKAVFVPRRRKRSRMARYKKAW